jgi:hypothetical protein
VYLVTACNPVILEKATAAQATIYGTKVIIMVEKT